MLAVDTGTCAVELEGGGRLRALAVRVGGPGTPTTVSLRPERVHLGQEAERCANRFEGEARELVYFGDHSRVRLAVCGRKDFIVKVDHSRGPPLVRPGDRVSIGFAVEDCRALDPD